LAGALGAVGAAAAAVEVATAAGLVTRVVAAAGGWAGVPASEPELAAPFQTAGPGMG
jgi:hypothetical protein